MEDATKSSGNPENFPNLRYFSPFHFSPTASATIHKASDNTKTCSTGINGFLPKSRMPFYTIKEPNSNKFIRYEPTSEQIILTADQTLYASCPGQNNQVNGSSQITCSNNAKFIEALNTTTCVLHPEVAIDKTKVKCSSNNQHGLINRIGYRAPDETFIGLYDICQDPKTSNPFYMHYRINGYAINGKSL